MVAFGELLIQHGASVHDVNRQRDYTAFFIATTASTRTPDDKISQFFLKHGCYLRRYNLTIGGH